MWDRLKGIGLVALAAFLTTLVGAGSASATVLEVAGATKNEAVTITGSLEPETSMILARTDGTLSTNRCKGSHVHGTTSTFAGTKVTGALSTLTFTNCDFTVTVDNPGKLYVEHIAGTTDGTVFSEEAEVTVEISLGFHVNCKTNAGADIGKLIGKSSGNATMEINTVLNCGFLLPSTTLNGAYTVTSPTGLGVVDKIPPPTTLEVAGTTRNEAIELTASLETGSSATLARTDGTLANTCRSSHVHGTTSTFTGTKVTGALSTLTFTNCDFTVTVDNPGKLYVEHIAGTTDGTVYSEEAEVTVETSFGFHVNCKTNAGTDIGRLTGKSSGNATIDINAVLNCGFLLPSATWNGSYWITSPAGLGVSA